MVALADTDKIQDANPTGTFSIRETDLGDGYVRVAKRGLNNARRSYRISWIPLPEAEAFVIVEMLRNTEGYISIQWTPPGEASQANWLVKTFSYPHVTPMEVQVSATLEEFFG